MRDAAHTTQRMSTMGYTHYIKPTRVLTDEEWNRLCAVTQSVFDTTEIRLGDYDGTGNPYVGPERIRFNGRATEDADYETCALDRTETGFSCCKTAYRPYDVVVVAFYLAFQEIHGGEILSSDGEGEAWDVEGRALLDAAKEAIA